MSASSDAARHLPPDRIEAGDDHGVGGVVDDDVDAGGGLEGADVPALAADDPALHLVARQGDGGDGALRGVLGAQPLDGHGDDSARVPVGGAARLVLDVAHQGCGLASGLVLDPLQNLPPGILGGEPGDALQLDPLLLGQPVGLSLPAPEAQLPLGQRLLTVRRSPLPGIDLLQLPVLDAGPFLGTALQPVPFLPPPQDLSIEILPQLERLHLGAEQQVGLGRFGVTLPLRADPLGIAPARP